MKINKLRVVGFLVGVLTLALGSVLVQKTGLGIAPIEALAFNINQLTGIGVGTLFSAIGVLFVMIQMIILHKEFKMRDIIQLVFMFIYGFFVDMILLLLFPNDFQSTMSMKWIIFAIGQSISFIGIGLFVASNVIIAPLESLVLTVSKKMKLEFKYARWIVEALIVIVALMLYIIGDLQMSNIGLGTVLILVFSGPVIQYAIESFSRMYTRLDV